VRLANPKTLDFQVVRTSLLPGLLKTIRENRNHSLPMRIFETADVVFKDKTLERQARNERHAAAVWCNKTAGFEMVHGILDRIMQMLEVPRISSADANASQGYYIAPLESEINNIYFELIELMHILRRYLFPRPRGHDLLPVTRGAIAHRESRWDRQVEGQGYWRVGRAAPDCAAELRHQFPLFGSRVRPYVVREVIAAVEILNTKHMVSLKHMRRVEGMYSNE